MDTSLIHVQSPYIEMMKNNFFFFRSSTNDENKTPSPPLKSKEVSSWRSVSLSSGSFYDSGLGKKNFTDLSKSPHGHSKKVHPKKSSRDSSRDLSVPLLIRTITRLTKEKVQMASEVSSMLWNQVAERASAKQEASILQAELDSRTRRLETEKNELKSVLEKKLDRRSSNWSLKLEKYQIEQHRPEKVKGLKSETLLTTVLREKLYSEEMDIKQLQANLAITVRVHQNSTCGAAENIGTAAKPNGIMHEPVCADRPNVFSKNILSILSCIQTAVNIPSQTTGPSTFELSYHALIGPGREGGVRGSQSWTSIYWFTCSTSCVFDPVWSDNKGIKLDWGYNISCHDNPCYVVVASVLLGAAVSQHLSVTDPLAARQDALQSIVIRRREGFRRKDQNSSVSSSEGYGSSVKRIRSADAGHLGNATMPCTGDGSTWNNIEGINSDKSIDSGRPSLALRSSSCRSVVQEPEVGSSYVDRNLEHNISLVVCSSSGLKSQGGDSSKSTSANQQILDLNLALAFQEKLSDPRITSILKQKGRHTDRELANLLQDKGLDPNFAVMLKENGLDPKILALLQRSSLDADREHRDSNPPVTNSNNVEDVLPNHISFSAYYISNERYSNYLSNDTNFAKFRHPRKKLWLYKVEYVVQHKPLIPPLAGPAPGAIPSMSLQQFQPMLPSQQAQPYGSESSQQFFPLGHANVAMSQPSQIQFPQPMQQVTGRPVVGMHSMPQGPPTPHDFQGNLPMLNNHMPGSGDPNLPLSSSYNVNADSSSFQYQTQINDHRFPSGVQPWMPISNHNVNSETTVQKTGELAAPLVVLKNKNLYLGETLRADDRNGGEVSFHRDFYG
ncbi:hypothetical protein FXO38_20779 [Capsicum annuum]|nr:hypothetical protein FXO38_20779 [Capsicum annuum]